MNRTIIYLLSLVLGMACLVVATPSAHAQRVNGTGLMGIDPEDAVDPTIDVQGHGVKVGEGTVLHPVFGVESGIVSNVFYESGDAGTPTPVAAGLLRLMAEGDISSLPASRLVNNDAAATNGDIKDQQDLGVFEYDLAAHASYDIYYAGDEQTSQQGGLGFGVLFNGIVNPEKPLALGIFDNFNRLLRPTNFESNTNTNRDINVLKLHLAWNPYGRSISFVLHYVNTIDVFEQEEQRFADRFHNALGARINWQILPRTRLYADVTGGIYTGLGDASTKVTSYPLAITAAVQTNLGVNSTFVGRIGYANGFYQSGPNYSSIVGGAQLGYRFSPYTRATALYSYYHEDSINANFYRDHLFGINFEQRIPPFMLVVAPEVHLRNYDGIMTGGLDINGPDSRDDVIFFVPVEMRYSFRDWFAIALEYSFTSDQTDYRYIVTNGDGSMSKIDPSYTRHELLLGVRAAL